MTRRSVERAGKRYLRAALSSTRSRRIGFVYLSPGRLYTNLIRPISRINLVGESDSSIFRLARSKTNPIRPIPRIGANHELSASAQPSAQRPGLPIPQLRHNRSLRRIAGMPAAVHMYYWQSQLPRSTCPMDQPQPKLLDQVRARLRSKHYARRTEQSYIDWITRYVRFHQMRHPRELGPADISAFLTHLAVDLKVAACTQNQARSALLFLYREVLGIALDAAHDVVAAKTPQRLPTVLTKDEVRALLAELSGDYRLMAQLLYGSGLRLMECLRLRVKDLDFTQRQLIVRDGKGMNDRLTMLPDGLVAAQCPWLPPRTEHHHRPARRLNYLPGRSHLDH